MIPVLLLMAAGILSGLFLGKFSITQKINDKLINWAIYLLLLLLGIGVGVNKKIIENIYSIGFQSFIITMGAITGSVAVSWLIYKLFFRVK